MTTRHVYTRDQEQPWFIQKLLTSDSVADAMLATDSEVCVEEMLQG